MPGTPASGSLSQHAGSERAIGFMTIPPEIRTGSSFATRLGAFYAAFFAGAGVQLPFFPLWLEAKGLDPAWIGIVLSAPVLVRLVAVPLITRAADRRDALRAAIVIASIGTVFGYALVGFAQGPVAILVAFMLASVFYTPIMPLTDAYALRGLRRHGGIYGPVRLWGSAAFIVGNLAAGLLSANILPRDLIWLIVAGWAAAALASFALAPLDSDGSSSGPQPSAKTLLRSPGFLAVIAAASLIQASHAVYYVFSAIDWRAAGLGTLSIGGLWALGVLAEIVLFALAGRLPAWIGAAALLALGGVGAVIRWSVMAFDPPAFLLPWLQCLHALSFGATHLGAMGFLARAAPPGLAATAQGYLALAMGVAMAVLMALSGLLYAAYGGFAYAAMALAAAAGGGFALVAHRADRS
jgi:MFS transporter, PPP family, 3-phenylpropionic acid transporter